MNSCAQSKTRADAERAALIARLDQISRGSDTAGESTPAIDLSSLTPDHEQCARVLSQVRPNALGERELASVVPSEALPLLP